MQREVFMYARAGNETVRDILQACEFVTCERYLIYLFYFIFKMK